MKGPKVLALVVSLLVVAISIWVAVTIYWQRQQLVFNAAPKLVAAIHAYSRDLTTRRQPVPDSIGLPELVHAGYLSAQEVRAFDGIEVTIATAVDESRPQAGLIRMRLPDGSVLVAMADGSVQHLQK